MAKPQPEDSDEGTPVLEVVVQLPSSAPPSASKSSTKPSAPSSSSSSSSTSSSSRALFTFPSKWDDAEKWLRSSSKSAPGTVKKHHHHHHHHFLGGFRKLHQSQPPPQQIHPEELHSKNEEEEEDQEEVEDREKKMMIDSADGEVSVLVSRFSFPMMPKTGNCGEEEVRNPAGQLRIQKPSSDLADACFDFKQIQNQQQQQQPKSPTSLYESVACIAPGAQRSISMRDMGTEMTPIASQEPSRTATPLRTPTMISPRVSPGKIRPIPPPPTISRSVPNEDPPLITIDPSPSQTAPPAPPPAPAPVAASAVKGRINPFSSTRQEIRVLGTQLGKSSIAAWATREEEDEDASKCLKVIVQQQQQHQQQQQPEPVDSVDRVKLGPEVRRSMIESRAAAWEEAEYAKYMARYEREEAKIVAWENHQKAKAEAELRRMEVKVERMRSHAHERVMNKLAASRRRAEELRAAAEAKRGEKAAKTAEKAVEIRKGGRVSSSSPSHFLRCCLAGV